MLLTHALRISPNPAHPPVVAFAGAGGKSAALFRLAGEIVAAGQRVVTTTTTRIGAEQIALAPAHLLVTGPQIDWAALEQALDSHGHCLLLSIDQPPKASGVDPRLVDALARRAPELNLAAVLVEADGSARRPVKAPAPHEPVIPDATTLLVPVLGLDAIGLPLAEPHVHRPEQLRGLLGIADPATRFTPQMAARLLLHPQGGAKGRPAAARLLPLLNKADNPSRRLLGRLIAHLLAGRGQSSLLGAVGAANGEPVLERWGPTAAVVLAAGAARRMGAPKQLLEIDGEVLVLRAARLALESGADRALVVSGAYGERVEAALAGLRAIAGERLRLVHNPAWEMGQASSIHAAVQALSVDCQAALFFPVDQPNLPVSLLRRLWQPWREGSNRVATAVDGEVRGAPAIFDRRYFPELLALRGDQGARPLLKRDAGGVVTMPTTAFALADVDTPQDWARLART
ncbi:MAG: putative selenium-dependent hydroxylase accessory protein YqeC [Chloroflexi bacterium]|nr:putative selenium-dependent hydroxylase accessory protein YqeC [Chloroflexota bacterium]